MLRLENHTLKPHAYYNTGGKAQFFFQPENIAELSLAMQEIHEKKLSFFYLGAGTNSLVSDEPWLGAVVSFAKMRILTIKGSEIRVGAGIENSELAEAALANKLDGASWMFRLPGQLGGTVRMNARCYGGEISEIVSEVITVTPKGEIKTYRDKSVFRGYKDTIFMQNEEAIGEVALTLKQNGDTTRIKEHMLFCESDRRSKGQFEYPTCGCVFKNNYAVGVPSGLLLDASGGKTLVKNGVSINPHHANFVYNKSGDSRTILEVTLAMRELVFKKFGVWMDYEMEMLGQFPEDLMKEIKSQRQTPWNEAALAKMRKEFQSKA